MTIESPLRQLPIFPCFYERPTAERLERTVERLMDRADSLFLAGSATQAEYDAWTKALDAWAASQPTREQP